MKDSQKLSGAMSDPRTAPYGSVRFADVDTLAEVDPGTRTSTTARCISSAAISTSGRSASTPRPETPATW